MTPPPADLLPCRKCKKIPLILDCDWTEPITYHAACDCKTTNHTSQESCIAEWNEKNRPQPIAGDAWDMKQPDERSIVPTITTSGTALRRPAQPSWTEVMRLAEAWVKAERELVKASGSPIPALIEAEKKAEAAESAFTAAIDRPAREKVCAHLGCELNWDYKICKTCGMFGTDSQWGIASNKWFRDRDEAQFYQANGRYPDARAALAAMGAERA